MTVFKDVLVAIDLSKNSLPPLKQALEFQAEGSNLTCLHVVPENGEEAESFRQFYKKSSSEEGLLENYALPWLENWLSDVDVTLPSSVDLLARVGDPHEEILQEAETGDYDVIVAGTHGRTGVKRYWMGSVAESLVRRATCPVLTVRAKDPHPGVIEE